MKIFFFTQMLY